MAGNKSIKQGLPDFLTTTELAKLLGLGSRRVQQLVQDGIITREDTLSNKQRKFKSNEAVRQYIDYAVKRAEEKSENQIDEIVNLKKEKLKYEVKDKRTKARLQQIKLNEFEGKMHSAEDVEYFTNDLVFSIRGALMSMPARLALDLSKENDPNVVRGVIKKEVTNILEELSNYEYDREKYLDRLMEREKLESIDLDDK